jgi:hypothetical protein
MKPETKLEIILYQPEDNRTCIEVRLENETVWHVELGQLPKGSTGILACANDPQIGMSVAPTWSTKLTNASIACTAWRRRRSRLWRGKRERCCSGD